MKTRNNSYLITNFYMKSLFFLTFIKPPELMRRFLKNFYHEFLEQLDQRLVCHADYFQYSQPPLHYHQI